MITYDVIYVCIINKTDFAELNNYYNTILNLMPGNHEVTVGKLQNYITFDQICVILSNSNSAIANKQILDYLIERMSCREDLLDLCDQLESIIASHDLKVVITKIRSGKNIIIISKLIS